MIQQREGSFPKLQRFLIHCLSASQLRSAAVFLFGLCGRIILVGTLPVLKLMTVYLAVKCLPTILNNSEQFVTTNLCMATDAPVVFSWLLSQSMASKNIFAKNRQKDIVQMNHELESRYGLRPLFKYVAFTQNTADLITRGLTLRKSLSNFEFWCSGPPWLREIFLQ